MQIVSGSEEPARSDDTFYADLPHFEDFSQVSDERRFRAVPWDWHVVISDIRGSTKAIAEGRYKHVNMIGAACITAAVNAVKRAAGDSTEIPYSFGGDGATILVPDILLKPVRIALLASASMAYREFGFELRIGSVPVSALREMGRDVTLAKLRLSPGNDLAMFGGGGVALADSLIKQDEFGSKGFRFVADGSEGEPDLTGLSCRWEPLKSRKGTMLSLIVQALPTTPDGRNAVYDGILSGIAGVFGGDLRQGSPVTEDTLRFKWIPKGLRMEAQLTRHGGPFWRRLAFLLYQSFIQYLLERFDKAAGGYDAPAYRQELRDNSDYRRFDDILRLVLDCSTVEVEAIEALLRSERERGTIAYGIHKADQALMTCLMFNLEQSEHVHFVDGDDGGFTQASIGFKKQLLEG